jgi:hypothetical protein
MAVPFLLSGQNCTLYGVYHHESSSGESQAFVTHVTVARGVTCNHDIGLV